MTTSVPTIVSHTAHTAAAVAIVLPLAVLLCWTYDHRLLSDLHPSFNAVKPQSLLSLLLCGIALRLQLDPPFTVLRRRTAQACGLLACLSAALVLSEHLFAFDFGSDEWFFTRPETPGDPDPERTAPPTAFAILLLGSALWRLDGTPIGRHDPAQYGALLGGMVGGVALVGYLYEVQSLYKVGTFSSISLLTGMLLAAVGLGILCARPEKGFMATLVSDDLGGLMLRRILPFAIALPILAGWIRLTAQRSGYYSFNFGVAVAVAVVMLIVLALLWVLAGTLNSTDEQKKHLLQILQQREARHRLALRAGRMGTFHHDLDNQAWICSPELETIFGVPTMTFGGTFAAFMEIVHHDDRPLVDQTIRDAIQKRSSYDMECRIVRAVAPKEAWIAITGQVLPDVQGRPRQITGVMFDITERKQAETALREREEQLRVITDALPGLIAYVDRHERYRFVNAGYERHFNLPRDRIVGRSVSDLVPQQYQEVQAYIHRALNGEQVSFETASGRAGEKTLLTTYVPNRTTAGTVAGLYALTTDITDRKRTEQALQESKERFRHLFEQASDGIVLADMAGRYLDANRRTCQMLGYSHEELLAMKVTDILSPQDCRRLEHIQAVLLDGRRHSGEWTLRKKDGGLLHVEVSARLQSDKRWHAIVRDIAERKRAEAGLRESEAHFRMLADATPVLVWMAGTDRQVTWLNRSWLEYTGRNLDNELGDGWTTGIHPEDRTSCVDTFTVRFDRHEPFEMEYRLRKHDASYGWILSRGVPLLTSEGSFTGYLGASIDITDRKQAEERLHEWTAELEQRVRERTHALVLSQERLRALASDLSTTEQQERRRLATELHDYLAQLLVVGRMKLGQAKPHVREPKIQQLLSEADDALTQSLTYTRFLVAELSPQVLYQFGLPAALKWLAGQMKTHGLTVETHCDVDHLPLAENSAVILYQSVRELLFNVVKHAGTDEASVTLTYDGEDTLTITVVDRGCGFNPAGATEPGGHHAGRFGLFNIQERVEAIGGRLHLTSAKGNGTSISLVAPLAAEPSLSPSPSLPRAAQPAVSSAVHSQRLRILLVDDHAMVRQGLRSVLENYQDLEVVGEAGDGEAAISLTAALNPDVVVMDITMPRVDGIAATRRIVAAHPDIVVIGLSVQNERHIEDAVLRAGAAVFVTKERAAVQLYEAIVSTVRARA
jgi:PAS domain S-box-containing protein